MYANVGRKEKGCQYWTSSVMTFLSRRVELQRFNSKFLMSLTHQVPVLLSYRNQSIDMVCKSSGWFLYEGKLALYKFKEILHFLQLLLQRGLSILLVSNSSSECFISIPSNIYDRPCQTSMMEVFSKIVLIRLSPMSHFYAF